jgi:hypothetical protein
MQSPKGDLQFAVNCPMIAEKLISQNFLHAKKWLFFACFRKNQEVRKKYFWHF